MTKIWKYRSDNGSCSSGGTVRYTPVRIWRGFWLFCHDAEPSSSWCFREYRYQRCSTRHMQASRWQIDLPYVLGFWRESLQCWSHCSWVLCTSSQSAISACTSRVIPLRCNVTVPTHPYWQSNTKAAKHSLSFKSFAVFFWVVFLLFRQVSEDSCQSSAAANSATDPPAWFWYCSTHTSTTAEDSSSFQNELFHSIQISPCADPPSRDRDRLCIHSTSLP